MSENSPIHHGDNPPSQVDEEIVLKLKEDILDHFKALGLPSLASNKNGSTSKEMIRLSHALQRKEVYFKAKKAFGSRWPRLLQYIANGDEVNPETIKPFLRQVNSKDWTGFLFRFATLLWSVPVSPGYGRRMRYLVMDRSNNKLIGIFAVGDPVFNLKARDEWIGWNVYDRENRLVNVMDAYVVGAVPPYSNLLGGKLVASLIGSDEVSQDFSERYQDKAGIISGKKKSARLALVTVSSALGRSSLYNRLKLVVPTDKVLVQLLRIGETRGYGHFHLSNGLFDRIRQLLTIEQHPYSSGHQYGDGPNWRFRVTRVGLKRLGLDEELIRHGISREVYAMPLASNFREFLLNKESDAVIDRPSVNEIASAALQRWVLPRAKRRPEYADFRRNTLIETIEKEISQSTGSLISSDAINPDEKPHVRQMQIDDLIYE